MPASNVVELIFRAVNQTSSGIESVRASVAQVSPAFDRLRSTVLDLGAQYQKTGQTGTQSLMQLAVAIKAVETAHGGATRTAKELAGAEAKIYQSATASLADGIAKQREYNAIQQQITKSTREFGGTFSGVSGQITAQIAGMAAGLLSVNAAITFIKNSFKEFFESEAGVRALSASIEVIGGDVGKLSGKAEQAVASLAKITFFHPDDLRAALTTLVTITGDFDSSLKLLNSTADLAVARNMDLGEAATLVGKAIEGNVGALSRYGIKLSESDETLFAFGTSADRAAQLQEKFNQSMGNRAEKAMGTHQAKLKEVQNSWKNFHEEIGSSLTSLLDWFEPIGRKLNELRDRLYGPQKGNIALAPPDIHPAFGVESGGGSALGMTDVEKARANERFKQEGERIFALIQKELGQGIETTLKDQIDALNAADAAAKQYAADLANLVGGGKDWERQQHLLSDAIRIVNAQTGNAGAGAVKFADQLNKIAETAALTGGHVRDDLIPQIERLYNLLQHPQIGAEFSAIGRGLPGGNIPPLQQSLAPGDYARGFLNTPGFDAWFKRAEKDWDQTFKEGAERLGAAAKTFGQGITDVFTDLATTGGKNFGQIAGQLFNELVKQGGQSLVQALGAGIAEVFGAPQITETPGGRFTFQGATQDYATRQEALAATPAGQRGVAIAGAGIGAIGQAASLISGRTRQSAASTVLGFAATGASIGSLIAEGAAAGGYIGAAIGAVVGGIIAAITPAVGKSYPYARFGVTQGQAFFDPTQNIDKNAARDALAKIQATYDQFFAGYVKILLRFPTEFLPQVISSLSDVLPKVGLAGPTYGDIGGAASANFWKHFTEWLAQGMPREIAGEFKPVFEHAFTGMGYTVDRFNAIWDALGEMDPAKAMQLVDQWAQFSAELPKAFEFLSRPFEGRGGLLDWADRENRRTAADKLSDSFEPIYKLLGVVGNLPLSEQISTWGEINRLTQEVQTNVKSFMQEIAQGIRDVTNSFDAQIRDLTAQGFQTAKGEPDYQRQAQYYKDYADQLRARIATAASPQEAQALGQELQQTISTILNLGQQMGPEAGEAFRKWAIDTLTEGRDLVIDRLHELGDAVAKENADFVARIQGPWETFTGAATNALDAFTDALNRAKYALINPRAPGPVEKGNLPPIRRPIFQDPGSTEPPAPPPPGDNFGIFSATTIGDNIGTAIAAALSRSDALNAIAGTRRDLRTLSETPTPLPIISVTTPKPQVTVTPIPPVVVPPYSPPPAPPVVVAPPAPPPVAPVIDRSRDAALAAIADVLGRLTDRQIPALTGALSGTGGAFPALPTGPWDAAGSDYVPTHHWGAFPKHPFMQYADPTSPVLTPEIWAGWNSMQRAAGNPEYRPHQPANTMTNPVVDRLSVLERALEIAIKTASDGESKGMQALAALLNWLPRIAEALENQGKEPITIVLPTPGVSTSSAGPSTRRGRY